jgi:protein TonB
MILGFGVIACNSSVKAKSSDNTDTTETITIEEQPEGFDENYIYSGVEKKAEFTGGTEALMKFIEDNMDYSRYNHGSIQGKVYVTIIVEKSGKISNIEVVRGAHRLLDDEAIRIVEKMPKWNPAEHNGKIVRSYFTFPVIFKLNPY